MLALFLQDWPSASARLPLGGQQETDLRPLPGLLSVSTRSQAHSAWPLAANQEPYRSNHETPPLQSAPRSACTVRSQVEPMKSFLGTQFLGLCKASPALAQPVTLRAGSGHQLCPRREALAK